MNLWSSVALAINLETMAPGSFGLSEFYGELVWKEVTPQVFQSKWGPPPPMSPPLKTEIRQNSLIQILWQNGIYYNLVGGD